MKSNPGFYPGYHILKQQHAWDETTLRVVMKRLDPPPPLRFFSSSEAALLAAVCERMLPQSDRDPDARLPIVPVIDERLAEGRIDGYRFADMPPDGEAHRLGLEAIQTIARTLYACDFTGLDGIQQDTILLSLHDGVPAAAEDIWASMSVIRYWSLLLDDVVTAYYQHPWAWDEIGFGGPAYPRGYMRLEGGEPEPWEVREQRYDFQPPADQLSSTFTPLAHPGPCWPRPGAKHP